jgi:hypothetical protein
MAHWRHNGSPPEKVPIHFVGSRLEENSEYLRKRKRRQR